MALLGFDSRANALRDIGWLTLREYYLRMDAYRVKMVYHDLALAKQAWFNQAVQATTGSGKHARSKYQGGFVSFFDLNDELAKTGLLPSLVSKGDQQKAQIDRYNDFDKLKAAGKIIPWSQRNHDNIEIVKTDAKGNVIGSDGKIHNGSFQD